MGSKKNVTVEGGEDHIKIVSDAGETTIIDTQSTGKTKAVKVSPRSRRYRDVRALVDRNKLFHPTEAIELVKRTSYSSFVGTVSADLVLKDVDNHIVISFPHTTGKSLNIAIVSDELLETIAAGKIDFDILLTTPNFMPKLAKLARVLGPKGLMPNPKNGTIVNDPEKAKAELLGGKTILKSERKAPLFHVTLGKTNSSTSDLVENLQAVLKATEGRVLKITVSASMSPGVKVFLEKKV